MIGSIRHLLQPARPRWVGRVGTYLPCPCVVTHCLRAAEGVLLDAALQTPCNVPEKCGKGHPLTPENLHMADREGRWRCRQCGRTRALAFRERQKTAA